MDTGNRAHNSTILIGQHVSKDWLASSGLIGWVLLSRFKAYKMLHEYHIFYVSFTYIFYCIYLCFPYIKQIKTEQKSYACLVNLECRSLGDSRSWERTQGLPYFRKGKQGKGDTADSPLLPKTGPTSSEGITLLSHNALKRESVYTMYYITW